MKKLLLVLTGVMINFLLCPLSATAQYRMEKLNRGIVAIRTDNSNFVSWRWLGTEDNITFNLYRNSIKVNTSPLEVTNYTDIGAPASASYAVKALINNVEQELSEAVTTWQQAYWEIPLQVPSSGATPDEEAYNYAANDCSMADLDGDGEWEIIVKWDPNYLITGRGPSGYTGNTFIDGYKMNGTRLWRIDLGKNIRSGPHYVQFQVYDFDGDGKAEMMVKTADGTIDGEGIVIGSDTADYRNSSGMLGLVLSGPEFLTVFNGVTGKAMATSNYLPQRGTLLDWGDDYGNRADRFRAGVAYLDGKTPSALFCRGYYARLSVAAWDWKGGKLTSRWIYDTGNDKDDPLYGQGNSSLSIADVDDDGKQEVISGAAIIDDNGEAYYSTGNGHGDAGHVSDFDPDLPGIEVVNIQERFDEEGLYMYSATDKKMLWAKPSVGPSQEGPGRGACADITTTYRGAESWALGGGVTGLFTCKGVNTTLPAPTSSGFLTWWDGDLLRELLNGTKINKYDGPTLLTANGCSSNTSRQDPALSGDFFGDWREEVMWRTSDNKFLRIYSTTLPTAYKIRTLMHDPQYRVAIAWQNTGYNQPPHPSFYLGDGMDTLPKPNITTNDILTTTGYEELESQQASTFFPNPFNESMEIRSKDEFKYEVFDLTGTMVEIGRGRDIKMIGFDWDFGMYIVKIYKEATTEIVKVVKN